MKNPAGVDCQYFFGDYFRGKNREECRLLKTNVPALAWEPKLCVSCPVPAIRRANSCQDMQLKPSLKRPFPLMPIRVEVAAYCRRTQQTIAEPQIGCGQCHQLPAFFLSE